MTNEALADEEYFLVPIEDEQDIQDAFALIDDPDILAHIISARIDYADENTLNRNYALQYPSAWSWEVTEFHGFAEMSAEAFDGNPGFVEDNLTYWVETLGIIGFWSYTIIGDLALQPDSILDNGWKYSNWFGVYWDLHYPWVYHESEGWVYIIGMDSRDVWLWSDSHGLLSQDAFMAL